MLLITIYLLSVLYYIYSIGCGVTRLTKKKKTGFHLIHSYFTSTTLKSLSVALFLDSQNYEDKKLFKNVYWSSLQKYFF